VIIGGIEEFDPGKVESLVPRRELAEIPADG
jgi:hypothetical protein